MREFIYIRHGQTEANSFGLMCGRSWNVSLSSVGREQSLNARKIIEAYEAEIDHVFVSTLERAIQTARLIFGSNTVFHRVEDLEEWDIGEWDRKPFNTVKDDFLGSANPPGGESRHDFKKRISSALDTSLSYSGTKAIVSHGAVWLAIQELYRLPQTLVENGIPFRVYETSTDSWKVEKL